MNTTVGEFSFSYASRILLLTGALQPGCQQNCSGICHILLYWPQSGQSDWKLREASVLWHEIQLLTLPDFVPHEQYALTFEQNSKEYCAVSRMQSVCPAVGTNRNTVRSRFATVLFTTIHFYDPCPVGPNTPDMWCITVATQESFLYLGRF